VLFIVELAHSSVTYILFLSSTVVTTFTTCLNDKKLNNLSV